MRLIDADDFIKKFSYAKANSEEENEMCATVRRMIKEQATACEKEVQHARYKKCVFCAQIESLKEECDVMIYRPSNHKIYGRPIGGDYVTPFCLNYCPECGKKMVSGEVEIND